MRHALVVLALPALVAFAGPAGADAPQTAPLPPAAPEDSAPEPAAANAGEEAPVEAPVPEENPVAAESEEANTPEKPREQPAAAEQDAGEEAPAEAPVPEENPLTTGDEAAATGDSAAEPETEATVDESEGAGAAEADRTDTVIDNEVHEPAEPVVVAPPDAGPAEDEADFAACEAELAALGASYERAAPIDGEGSCGAPRPIRLTAVGGIEIRPALALRCATALSLGLWVDRVVAPLSDLYMDDSLRAVLVGTGYQCRRRRGDGTAKWSEHAFANAVDISGMMFESGDVLAIEERTRSAEPGRSFQAGVRGGACAFFTTVLGPTTNAAHANHLHVDMAERRGGYRLCE